MSEPNYLIDTSVFIQAFRAYYSFALCPGFWDAMIQFHKQGRIFSLDKVLEEICFGEEDELVVWSKAAPKGFFADTDDTSVIQWYGAIQAWANAEPQFFPAAKAAFAGETDAWIVAYAGAKNLTVVTQEVYSFNVKTRIPIPNVCKGKDFKVPCVDVFTMLTRLGVSFH
jgi:hypothetical protein